jgi:cytochrome c
MKPRVFAPLTIVACVLGLGLAAGTARAADAAKGAAAFSTYCAECHSMKEGKDKKGPSLFGTFGKPAAQREGFAYSDALRGSHLAWTADKLDAYVTNPRALVPGGKMKYDGLADAAERADLIAYLASVGTH